MTKRFQWIVGSLIGISAFIIICILVVIVILKFSKERNSSAKASATIVQVQKFYNGKEGFYLSIPTGNKSTCVWTWEAGSGAIPDTETTQANSATEKHYIDGISGSWNFKVVCVDDFGKQYVGNFPPASQ